VWLHEQKTCFIHYFFTSSRWIAVFGSGFSRNFSGCKTGRLDAVTSTLNLETGQIGDAFIIPANLNAGDTFLEQSEGSITLSGVEERTFAGARRTVVYASTSETMFYWDRSTGVLVEATTSTSDFTLTTRAEKTNIWQPQIFGLNPIILLVLIIVVVAAVSAILLIFRKRK
jgi:hypothetical protein